MTSDEFTIGLEFWCSERRWRCTDVGTRVVVAIRVDEATIVTRHEDRATTTRTNTGEEAERICWFDGPPYGVAEVVFDEDVLEACTLTREEQ